jgi:hypothetical protein
VNDAYLGIPVLIGLIVFLVLRIVFAVLGRRGRKYSLRDISAFASLRHGVGLAVESGQRLHLSLGFGDSSTPRFAAGLAGLSVLNRVARAASVSDQPPVATSGDASLAILSQDTLRNAYRAVGADDQSSFDMGQISGLTPFSFVAGTLPVIFDEKVSVNVLAGSFGSEVGLITDAAERTGGLTLAGSDNVPAQAVLYASAQEPLVGEELYAAGAYLQAGPMHIASLRVQDIFRWILIGVMLIGALLKFLGVL